MNILKNESIIVFFSDIFVMATIGHTYKMYRLRFFIDTPTFATATEVLFLVFPLNWTTTKDPENILDFYQFRL